MNDVASADANIQIAMLEVISEGISGAILVYDKNDLIVFASQQLLALLSLPKTFLVPGTRLRDFLGAVYDGGGRFSADASGARRTTSREDWIADQIATLWKERAEIVERRDNDRWLSFTKRRLSSGYGICVIRDVSELKKREEQWRADMERVQITEEVLDNLPFTVTVKDRSHTFVAVNKAACKFHNLSPEAILGHKGEEFQPVELRERLEAINNHVLDSGEELSLPERLTRADGSEVIIVANKYRIGKPGRYFVVTTMQDLTRFIGVDDVSHDAIASMNKQEFIEWSLRRGERDRHLDSEVSSLANRKVLVVSADPQVEADALTLLGELQLDVSSVCAKEELTLFLQLAREADIQVDLVVVDGRMKAACAEIAATHGIPMIEIDAGEMSADLISAVSSHFRGMAGEMHGRQDGNWQIVEEDGEPDLDILVAEDNEVNQIVFSQILEGLGYRYAIAADGEEAVSLWRERSPRLVLMDVSLPKLNGFEASCAIRALEGEEARTPIIGVLAQAFERDREQCFSSGMNDVILKPISPEALETVFEKFLGEPQQRTTFAG
ncbi:response regulator [Rhizobium deserti]|nr:response regulator [Rhizobium deserti]